MNLKTTIKLEMQGLNSIKVLAKGEIEVIDESG
jgi:hypothetical protein